MKNHKQYTVTPELKQARNEIILRMRKEGYTLQKIADRFNVTREYIRQILLKKFDITGSFSVDPREEIMSDEYSAFDLVELTGYEMEYIRVQLAKNWLPKPSRKLEKNKSAGIDHCFWKKTDIDKWIQLKIKYLKIALEGFINERLAYPYKFTHYKIQKRYKFLTSLDSGGWKGKLSYNSRRNDEVMKEYNNLIKPVQYVPTDYSKYLNMRTKEHFAEKGLYNGMETEKMIGIASHTIQNYRRKGVLKEGIHYFTGDHYFQRYMYDPEKTKQAILNGGYDLAVATGQKKRWARIRGDK
jgi:transcriptional regulator with XRE-family HTH domain